MRARLCLDELQSRSDGVGCGVSRSAEQAVRLAHFYEHGAEIVALCQRFTNFFLRHFLSEFHHGFDHVVHVVVILRINDLAFADVEAGFFGCRVEFLRSSDEDNIKDAVRCQSC